MGDLLSLCLVLPLPLSLPASLPPSSSSGPFRTLASLSSLPCLFQTNSTSVRLPAFKSLAPTASQILHLLKGVLYSYSLWLRWARTCW